jgi:predicted transcriptional regulator
MSKITNISFEGDSEDKRRITLLAAIMRIPVGTLVRRAIYQVYAKELNRVDELAENFYADDSSSKHNQDSESTE